MKPPIVFRKTAKDKEVMVGLQTFKDHKGMAERLKKTLYYGKHPKTDRPSLPMTELAVEIFSKAVPEGLGQIGMDYAASVSRNACISPCSMILAMAYIERVRKRSPDYLMQVSSSDLFLVSMMVASKFLYDEGEDEEVLNDEWAKSANVENRDLNQLERSFLAAIDWNLYGSPDLFDALLFDVEYKIALQKSKDRGWCTYTDLLIMSDKLKTMQCWPLLDSLTKVFTVGTIAYAVSIVVMVAAAVLTSQMKAQVARMVTHLQTTEDPTSFALRLDQNDSSKLTLLANSSHNYLPDRFFKHSKRHLLLNSLASEPVVDFDNPSRCFTRAKSLEDYPNYNNWFTHWGSYLDGLNEDCSPWLLTNNPKLAFETCNKKNSFQNSLSHPNLEIANHIVCIPTGVTLS